MAKFQKKPPVFDALQFTGGQANAKTIVEGVTALQSRFVARYIPAASEFGMEAGAIKEIKYTERLKFEAEDGSTTWYANLTDWVLVGRDGFIEVLPNAEFTAQYQPV